MRLKEMSPLKLILAGLLILITATVVFAILWYNTQLRPYDTNSQEKIRIIIKEQSTATEIANQLEKQQAIRSSLAMTIYLKLNGLGGNFKVGIYTVKQSQSMTEIIDHLLNGQADEMIITFYPGAMLRDKSDRKDKKDVTTVLKQAGFDEKAIDEALSATYESSVFSGRPNGAGLEGYIYGETYYMPADATAEQVLARAIDEFAEVIKQHDFEKKFADKGLSLYEGITLASIIEKESGCLGKADCEKDQRRIASVFYNRLKDDMPLGSDPTYQYVADRDGLERNIQLDSPYNTRIHVGLPPGPIAAPGLSALKAVAEPANEDYLYFLSGDDDITYFSRTFEEHEENIRSHCKVKCLIQ